MCREVDEDDSTVRRTWLKRWLIETEGFSESAAAYAVENINYDWYASALFYANNYEYWGKDIENILHFYQMMVTQQMKLIMLVKIPIGIMSEFIKCQ